MKAQHAPASPGQASLAVPRQWALTTAHWKNRQPNRTNAASSNKDNTVIAGVGNQAWRHRTAAGVATTGKRRGATSVWRT